MDTKTVMEGDGEGRWKTKRMCVMGFSKFNKQTCTNTTLVRSLMRCDGGETETHLAKKCLEVENLEVNYD